jgi:hypothetical protein
VLAQRFSCPLANYGAHTGSLYEYCTLNPDDGIFSLVGVVIVRDLVRRIDFTMRGSTLLVGDLMPLWGRPQISSGSHSMHLDWVGGATTSVRVESQDARFSPMLPVFKLSFTASSAPVLGLQ